MKEVLENFIWYLSKVERVKLPIKKCLQLAENYAKIESDKPQSTPKQIEAEKGKELYKDFFDNFMNHFDENGSSAPKKIMFQRAYGMIDQLKQIYGEWIRAKQVELQSLPKEPTPKMDEPSELYRRLYEGRHYLMGVNPKDLTIEDALEAFGFGRNGLQG